LHNKPAGCGVAEAYASGTGSKEEEEEEEEEKEEFKKMESLLQEVFMDLLVA
jgi:hypothetical protein